MLFNWECCSGCANDKFAVDSSPVPLIAFLLSRGFMVMASDFSLSALIKQWDESLLGPNPFHIVGEFDRSLTLRFDPEALKACDDSAQLQVLGELCAIGEAQVHALNGTKAYAVDTSVRPVQVLTVLSQLEGRPAQEFLADSGHDRALLSQVGPHRGLAGHCIIGYPGGGRLLTSSCHWIELTKLDADEASILAVAQERFGADYASNLRTRLSETAENSVLRRELTRSSAASLVQMSSPARSPSVRSRGLSQVST